MYVSSGLPWFVTVVPKPRMGGMTDPQPGQQVDELARMVAEMVGTQWEQVVASRRLQEESGRSGLVLAGTAATATGVPQRCWCGPGLVVVSVFSCELESCSCVCV